MILDKSMSPEAPSGGGYYAHAHPLHPDEEPVSRTYQYRKVMKPMLERKRRARINRCLDELKDLMVTALQSEGENVSKLEKADILELTVRHLHSLKRRGQLVAKPESSYAERFRAGFTHCASEVSQFIANATLAATAMQRQGPVDPQAGARLLQHLSGCIKRLENPQRVLHPIPIAPNGPVQLSPQRPPQPHPQHPTRMSEQQGEARGLKRCAGEQMEAPPRATKQHCYAPPSPPHSPASGSGGAAASTSADAFDAARSMWRPW